MATFRLFVYGTLKRDGCRFHALAGQRYLGLARTVPQYALIDLGAYPGMVPDRKSGQVVEGELYEVEESVRPLLDVMEGAPTLFRLEEIYLEGHPEPVLAYLYQRSTRGLPRCADGVWRNVPGRDEEE